MVSYETYALVRDLVAAQAPPAITMQGISRPIIPYAIQGLLDSKGETVRVFRKHMTGLELYLNPNMVEAGSAAHIPRVLQDALQALE